MSNHNSMISPLDRPASVPALRRLLAAGALTSEACADLEARTRAQFDWRKMIDRWLLGLAVLLSLAGVVDFFAHNWQRLGDMMKLGLAGGVTLACFGAALYLGLERLSGKLWLLGASCCVGVFLAVYGQVYQTDTNTTAFFVLWAALITPWTVVGRFVPLWLGWTALLNLALYNVFATGLFIPFFDEPDKLRVEQVSAIGLNIVFLVLREVIARRKVSWLDRGWSALVLLTAISGLGTWVVCTEIVLTDSSATDAVIAVGAFVLLTAAVFWFYIKMRPSLPALALMTLGACTVLAFGAARLLFGGSHDDVPGLFLLMGFLVLGLYGGGVFALIQISHHLKEKI